MKPLLTFIRKKTVAATLMRVALFFVAMEVGIFGLRLFVAPILKTLPLHATIIESFSYLLPAGLLGQVLTRYIFLFFSLCLYALFFCYIEGKRLRNTLLFPAESIPKSIVAGMGAMTILYVAALLFGSTSGILYITGFTDKSWAIIIGALLLDTLIKFSTDFAEELVFRSYILQTLAPAIGPHTSCICSALFFMAMHLMESSTISLVGQIIFGLLAGYVTLVYHNVYITTGMHLGVNVLGSNIFGDGGWVNYSTDYAGKFLNPDILHNVYVPLLALICFFVYKKLWRLDWSSEYQRAILP